MPMGDHGWVPAAMAAVQEGARKAMVRGGSTCTAAAATADFKALQARLARSMAVHPRPRAVAVYASHLLRTAFALRRLMPASRRPAPTFHPRNATRRPIRQDGLAPSSRRLISVRRVHMRE